MARLFYLTAWAVLSWLLRGIGVGLLAVGLLAVKVPRVRHFVGEDPRAALWGGCSLGFFRSSESRRTLGFPSGAGG